MKNKQCKYKVFLFRLISVVSLIMALVIGYSIFVQHPVDKALGMLMGKVKGDKLQQTPPIDTLLFRIKQKNKLIDSLSSELDAYRKVRVYKKATIDVESGTLNMREKPLLSSDIVARIPDGSVVEVLYFDTETYYLEGEKGRWVKVKYADKEGWVWDKYVVIEED